MIINKQLNGYTFLELCRQNMAIRLEKWELFFHAEHTIFWGLLVFKMIKRNVFYTVS
jgi:hypothetical protein